VLSKNPEIVECWLVVSEWDFFRDRILMTSSETKGQNARGTPDIENSRHYTGQNSEIFNIIRKFSDN